MTKQPEPLTLFGYNGILYADAMREKLAEKKRLERSIEEKMAKIQADLRELVEQKRAREEE